MTRQFAADSTRAGRRAGLAITGLVVLALAGCASGGPQAGDPDAPVMTVQVAAADMRFTPDVIEVPTGTRLVIELTNADAGDIHDLVIANHAKGQRLRPGESESIDVGVITEDLDGWCSVGGHRAMGMVMTVVATGADTP